MTSEILEAVPPVTPLPAREQGGKPLQGLDQAVSKADETRKARQQPEPTEQAQAKAPERAAMGPPEPPSMQEVAQAISEALAEVQQRGYLRELRFDYEHLGEGQFQLKVLDARTDKVLRTIPSEEQIEFAKRLERFLGLLVDEQA